MPFPLMDDMPNLFGDHHEVEVSAAKLKAMKANLAMAPTHHVTDFKWWDINGDGQISADDCPWNNGTAESKLWWKHVMEPSITASKLTPEGIKFQELYGNKFEGFYKHKPLITGIAGKGQGDMQYLIDKLQVVDGHPASSARNIAGWISESLYGG